MSSRLPYPDEVQRILAAKTYLLNHLHDRFTTAQLARRSGLGSPKLRDGFRLLFGVSLSVYAKQTRLLTGRFLLLHTDQPIKAVAALCGYAHYKNFITAYRRHFGHSPRTERSR